MNVVLGNTEGKGKVVAAATSSADLKVKSLEAVAGDEVDDQVKLWSNDSFRDIGTLEVSIFLLLSSPHTLCRGMRVEFVGLASTPLGGTWGQRASIR